VSARIARGVVEALGLSQRIMVMEADATSYVPQDPLPLLISETMDSGLMKEPIAAIFGNLSRYVAPDGLPIPESVTVKALLYREEHPVTQDFLATYCVRDTIHTAHDYDWSAPHAVFSRHTDCPLGEIKLEINPQVKEDDISRCAPEGFFLVVSTSVQVLGGIELRSDDHRESRGPDSLLTIPYRRSFFSERDKKLVSWWIRTEELSRLAAAARGQRVEPRVVLSYFAGARFGPKEITTIPEIPLEVYTDPMPDGNGDQRRGA